MSTRTGLSLRRVPATSAAAFVAIALALIVGAGAFAPRAEASVLKALSLEVLCQRADRIVLGRVEKIEARWTDDHSAIFSEVTLRVERSYKGPTGPGETMIVRKEGGSVGGIGMRVYGAAEFRVGEEALVFTEPRGGARFVSGMTQGKLRVTRAINGEDIVVGGSAGASLLGAPDPRLVAPRPLPDFERELVKVIDQATSGGAR